MRPERLLHDNAVELHGHAGGIEFQRLEEPEDGLHPGKRPAFAVHDDVGFG